MKVYYIQPFESNAFGHGGEKRSFQIEAFFSDLGITLEKVELKIPQDRSRWQRLLFLVSNFRYILSLKLYIQSKWHIQELSRNLMFATSQLPTLPSNSVVVYEHSIKSNWFIPILLAQQGCRVIALPHNLESLVPNQKSGLGVIDNPFGFFEEIAALRSSDLVLTISKEESWLLNLFGIRSLYFPYLPSSEEYTILNRIAKERTERKLNRQFLIFGSVSNPPTFKGMVELLRFLQANQNEEQVFHIVGFHSERLKSEIEFSSRFQFHGAVSTDELYRLYALVDGAIIHQTPSTGALTKIPELLSAHVPVICNVFGARNYFNFQDVYVYQSLTELPAILGQLNSEWHADFHPDMDLTFIQRSIINLINS
ncbi:MAG: hypothetical protein ACOYOT_05080 [Bacteroidales bacterium]